MCGEDEADHLCFERPRPMSDDFFDESREQSQIKSRIVAKYFHAWAKVVIQSAKLHGNRIAYIDLFAGPGLYRDGTGSTPISVLKKAAADPDMRDMLVTVFNDKNQKNVASLVTAISAMSSLQDSGFSCSWPTTAVVGYLVPTLRVWLIAIDTKFSDVGVCRVPGMTSRAVVFRPHRAQSAVLNTDVRRGHRISRP